MQHEETTATVRFLFVDCGPLKQMLTAHCQLWKSKLTGLLNSLAASELKSLHDYFRCAAWARCGVLASGAAAGLTPAGLTRRRLRCCPAAGAQDCVRHAGAGAGRPGAAVRRAGLPQARGGRTGAHERAL